MEKFSDVRGFLQRKLQNIHQQSKDSTAVSATETPGVLSPTQMAEATERMKKTKIR